MYEGLTFRDIKFVCWNKIEPERREEFVSDCEEIKRLLTETTLTFERNSILAGYLLRKLEFTGVYKYACRLDDNEYSSYKETYVKDMFFKFCERYFSLSKSTVYGLMQVYSLFGDEKGNVIPGYRKFKYSQLFEMASMTMEQRNFVSPEMTIAEIKAIKRKDKQKKKDQESAEVSPAEPPTESKVKKTSKYVFKEEDIKTKKEEFKRLVKYMFENFHYTLTLNGRKQGGQAFGGSLFDYLLERGYFDADTDKQGKILL